MSPLEKDRIIEQELTLIKKEIAAVDGVPGDVQHVLRCLHDYLFEEKCNVNAILECSGVSSPSIHARFKHHVGMSMRNYLEKQRMKAARQLLQHNGIEIHMIFFSVGYASYRTFDRAFRRCSGYSPTAYRKKMPKENV